MMMGRLLTRQAREREQRDELLSAYLDGELSARERARLEAQLATDPALQAEVDTLRHTVALVRDLPSVPIPRNFILPQTMAARPRPLRPPRLRRAWTAPLLTAATTVVSLLFIVVLAGDLLLSRGVGSAFAPATELMMEDEAPQAALAPLPVSEEVEAEKAVPAATMPALATEAPPKAAAEAESYDEEAPAMDNGGPSEELTAHAPTASPPVAEEAAVAPAALGTPEGTPSPEQALGGGGPTEEPGAPAPSPGPPVAEEAAVAPTALATATATSGRSVDSTEPTPGGVGEAVPPLVEEEAAEITEGGPGAPESEVAGLGPALSWWALEITLGLAALGLALATVWAWRTRRQ